MLFTLNDTRSVDIILPDDDNLRSADTQKTPNNAQKPRG